MYGAGEVAGRQLRRPLLGRHGDLQGQRFSVGYGHNGKNNELGQKSLTNNVIGATVDIGPGTLYGQYATIKDENPTGISTDRRFPSLPPPAARWSAAFQNAYNNAFSKTPLMHIGYRLTSGVTPSWWHTTA
jgi:predicted porin